MIVRQGRQRYRGIQTLLMDGCYFLCLCSIAEDAGGKPVDIIDVANEALEQGLVSSDGYVSFPVEILENLLPGTRWELDRQKAVPRLVADNEYTVLKYYNINTGYTHFRRRDVDTLVDSKTVKEGRLVNCYVFKLMK